MSSTTRGRRLFFAIFTISGFSGLIYEAIWSHYLKLFLGHAAYAQTLVLAIFMGGMAIGSWLMAKYSHRVANLLLGYAIVEGAIGFLGLIFHRTSIGVTAWAFDSVLPGLESAASVQFVKWTLGALLILPQSILLGMTFPLMSGATVRRFPERSGETLAMLYFTNSLGAAIGVLVSGFVLIAAVGLPGTIMTAGLLNVALALFVWSVVKYHPDIVRPAAPSEAQSGSATTVAPLILRWMLIGAAVTGAASFLYEIAWIRMLSLVLGSSTHSFEMMLSAFILGIALGGLWVRKRIDSLTNPTAFLATILTIMAIVAMLSLTVYDATFTLMSDVVRAFAHTSQGYVGITISSHVIAMLVMIPTTFFCGMTLPIMTQVMIRGGTGERAIGAVYAWNTAGAIAGVVVTVHVLMPTIGVKGVVIAGATLQLALAVVYRTLSGGAPNWIQTALPRAAVAAVIVALAAMFIQLDPLKLASGVFRHGVPTRNDGTKVTFLEHGRTATVSVLEGPDGVVSIATNGKPDAAIGMRGTFSSDEITMVLAGALPSLLHPHPQNVAVIGFGSGLTTNVLLASPAAKVVDTVEIEPAMVRGAYVGFMPRVARTYNDKRSLIHYEDAKTFFAANRKKYDVIVSEPSNPWVSGVSTLFSTEFYRQMTRYLEPDGMLIQWLQIYESDIDIATSVMKALSGEFSDFAIYSADNSNILLVAVRRGTVPPLDIAAFSSKEMKDELAAVGLFTPQDVNSRFLGNKTLFAPLLARAGIPANSDYFPFVDLHAERTRILNRNALELTGMQMLPVPFFELLDGTAEPRTETRPTSRPTSPRDQMAAHAAAVRIAVETGRYRDLDSDEASTLMTLRSTAEQCETAEVQRAWISAAYFVAASTNAPLSAKELASTWDAIGKTACASKLSTGDQQLLALFKATSQRNVAEIARVGGGLFASGYDFAEPAHLSFTILATASSLIAIEQPTVALETIRDYASGISTNPPLTLALRWLEAIGAERAKAAGAQLTSAARP